MPRGRRNNQQEVVEYEIDWEALTKERKVLPFLNNNYFEMTQKLNQKMECPICLEQICCKNCFTLLICGHAVHTNCYYNMEEPKCPMCRN